MSLLKKATIEIDCKTKTTSIFKKTMTHSLPDHIHQARGQKKSNMQVQFYATITNSHEKCAYWWLRKVWDLCTSLFLFIFDQGLLHAANPF